MKIRIIRKEGVFKITPGEEIVMSIPAASLLIAILRHKSLVYPQWRSVPPSSSITLFTSRERIELHGRTFCVSR